MSLALWFVFFYVLGGITLIPLSVLAVLLFFYWTLPQAPPDQDPSHTKNDGLVDIARESQYDKSIKQSSASSIADQSTLNSVSSNNTKQPDASPESESETGVDAYFSGTVVVSREYFIYPTGGPNNSGNPPAPASHQASMHQSESAYSALYKLFSNSLMKPGASSSASSTHSTASSSQSINESFNDPSFSRKNSSLSTFSSTSASSVSSNASNSSSSSTSKKTKLLKYHAVLRHGNLFLYEDSDHENMKHVIVIAHHLVTIWPPNLPDGELFAKRNAICLLKIPYSHGSPAQSDLDIAELLSDPATPPKNAFFLYTDSASEKEDFYFALLRASKRHPLEEVKDPDSISRFDPVYLAHPIRHKTSEIIDLIQTLHATSSQTRWLNALIGRIFLSVKDTPQVSNFWINKISTKLTRIKRPTFLGDIHVTRLSTGSSLPYFTNPKFIELTPEGKLTIETDVSYSGQFCVQITTKVLLNLGQRFKAREVTVALAITLQHLEGRLIIRVKPPPSDRIWYTFESMPKVSLLVEPIVSSRQVTYSFVTKAIENKIRDTVSAFLFHLIFIYFSYANSFHHYRSKSLSFIQTLKIYLFLTPAMIFIEVVFGMSLLDQSLQIPIQNHIQTMSQLLIRKLTMILQALLSMMVGQSTSYVIARQLPIFIQCSKKAYLRTKDISTVICHYRDRLQDLWIPLLLRHL